MLNTGLIQVNHPLLTATTEIEQVRQVVASPNASPGARACAQQALEHIAKQGQHESDTTRQAPLFVTRKVSTSGHITYHHRSYVVSKRLAGHLVPVRVETHRLIVTATFTTHKEFSA